MYYHFLVLSKTDVARIGLTMTRLFTARYQLKQLQRPSTETANDSKVGNQQSNIVTKTKKADVSYYFVFLLLALIGLKNNAIDSVSKYAFYK